LALGDRLVVRTEPMRVRAGQFAQRPSEKAARLRAPTAAAASFRFHGLVGHGCRFLSCDRVGSLFAAAMDSPVTARATVLRAGDAIVG
jgi:hypothetical protein